MARRRGGITIQVGLVLLPLLAMASASHCNNAASATGNAAKASPAAPGSADSHPARESPQTALAQAAEGDGQNGDGTATLALTKNMFPFPVLPAVNTLPNIHIASTVDLGAGAQPAAASTAVNVHFVQASDGSAVSGSPQLPYKLSLKVPPQLLGTPSNAYIYHSDAEGTKPELISINDAKFVIVPSGSLATVTFATLATGIFAVVSIPPGATLAPGQVNTLPPIPDIAVVTLGASDQANVAWNGNDAAYFAGVVTDGGSTSTCAFDAITAVTGPALSATLAPGSYQAVVCATSGKWVSSAAASASFQVGSQPAVKSVRVVTKIYPSPLLMPGMHNASTTGASACSDGVDFGGTSDCNSGKCLGVELLCQVYGTSDAMGPTDPVLVDLRLPPAAHAQDGGTCADGYEPVASLSDCSGASTGQFGCVGQRNFCAKYISLEAAMGAGSPFVSDVNIVQATCPQGYATIESLTNCNGTQCSVVPVCVLFGSF